MESEVYIAELRTKITFFKTTMKTSGIKNVFINRNLRFFAKFESCKRLFFNVLIDTHVHAVFWRF